MGIQRESVIREFQRDRFRLLAYIRALVGDPLQSEDIFQEVSVVVLQKAEEFIPGRDLAAWCRGIARKLILQEREARRRLRSFEDDRILDLIDVAFVEQEEGDLLDARRSQIRTCMERLSPSARELLDLRYVSGLSLRQLSERLGRSEAAVQVALSRLRRWLGLCVERCLQERQAVRQ